VPLPSRNASQNGNLKTRKVSRDTTQFSGPNCKHYLPPQAFKALWIFLRYSPIGPLSIRKKFLDRIKMSLLFFKNETEIGKL
jgi:hypothetical protein